MTFLDRCSVSMKVVFITAGLFAVLCSAAAGILLAAYSKTVIDDFALSNGRAQVNTGAAWIRSDMRQMEMSADSYGRWLMAQTDANVSTSSQILASFNESIFNETQTRLQTPGEILGWGFNFLLPPFSSNRTSLQSIQSSKDISGNGTKVDYTYSYTMEDGQTNVVYLVNGSGIQPRIQAETYSFNQLKYYLELQDKDDFWDEVLPWIASDGSTFLYLTYQRLFMLNGVPLMMQSWQSVQRWYALLIDSLVDAADSHLLIVDRDGHIVATTLIEQVAMDCKYTLDEASASYISCKPPFAYTHPMALIRDMHSALTILQPGETIAEAKRTFSGTSYFLVVHELINKGKLRLSLIWARTEDSATGAVMRAQIGIIVAACVFIAVSSGCVAFFGILGLLRPLGRIMDEMANIRRMEVHTIEPQSSQYSRISEIRRLQIEFESMGNVISSFAKYVPKEVVQDMLCTGAGLAVLGMKQLEITIMFLDIVNFTTMCETIGTEPLSVLLGKFFADMTNILLNNGATIDKFIGDAIMCFWGAPLECDQPEARACCSALDMRHTVRTKLQPLFSANSVSSLDVRIGINAGVALCGNIGGPDRMSFTAIGDTVNTAARLESLNKQLHTSILVSHSVYERVNQTFAFRYVGRVVVKGKTQGLQVYELHAINVDENDTHPMGCRTVSISGESCVSNSRMFLAKHRKQALSAEEAMRRLARKGMTCSPALKAAFDKYSAGVKSHDEMGFEKAALAFQQCRATLAALSDTGKDLDLLLGCTVAQAEEREAECLELAQRVPANWTPTLVLKEK